MKHLSSPHCSTALNFSQFQSPWTKIVEVVHGSEVFLVPIRWTQIKSANKMTSFWTRKFPVIWFFRSLARAELLNAGTFVPKLFIPKNISFLDGSFPGTFVPGTICPGNFHSQEQINPADLSLYNVGMVFLLLRPSFRRITSFTFQ